MIRVKTYKARGTLYQTINYEEITQEQFAELKSQGVDVELDESEKQVFNLQNTPSEQDYTGRGHSILVIKNGVPQKLLYIPAEQSYNWESVIRINPDNATEIAATTEIWYGVASCWEFVAERRLFPKGGAINA